MSIFGQDPVNSFLGKKPQEPLQSVTKTEVDNAQWQSETFFDDYINTPLKTAAWAIWKAWWYASDGMDLFSDFIHWDMSAENSQTKWNAEEKKRQENLAKQQQQQKSIQTTFLNGFKEDFNTKSPNKRVVLSNQVDEATKQYSALYDTIESMDGIEHTATQEQLKDVPVLGTLWFGTRFQTKDEYKRQLENEIIPAQQELLRRQSKYLDEWKGSTYAYNKAMEDEGSDELAQKISDFANTLQSDSNTAALKKFQKEWKVFQTGLAFIAKTFDNLRMAATDVGIGWPDVANEFKYAVGGAEPDAREWQKAWYGAVRNLYELWDGMPSLLSQVPAFVSGTAVEWGLAKLPSAMEWLAALSKSEKVIDFTDDMLWLANTFKWNHTTMAAFTREMLTDTMVYDPASQVFMGKGLTEQDIKDNMILNLPINLWIGLMARGTKTAQMLAESYDIQKTFEKDWTINVTPMELDLIKNGEYDLAQLSILNRSKVGWVTPDTLVNLRNITWDKQLAKNVNRVGENLQKIIERVWAKSETLSDTHLLGAALADNLISRDPEKTIANFSAFKAQQAANQSLEKSMVNNIESDNVNKFWTTKLTEAGKTGNIDLNAAITKYVKSNPEYSTAAELYRKISWIMPSKGFTLPPNTNERVLKRQLGKMVKDIYRDDIAWAGKLVEGEKLSPIHVFTQWNVKNIETGETQSVSDFFGKTQNSTYQKKAQNATVLDDIAQNAEVFEFFTKKLGTATTTDALLKIFSKTNFNSLNEQEVTLIRAALANEMLTDLASRWKKNTLQSLFSHPAYRMFAKNEDGTYSIKLENIDTTDLGNTLGKMFKTMDEMSIVKYLWDLKAQDEIITSLKTNGLKKTVETITGNHPEYLKWVWQGFSEMLMRKTTAKPNADYQLPKVSKEDGMRMILQLQKAFPNIPVVFGKLPEGVKWIVSPFEGKLIIDDSKMTQFTSLHEFGHVWIMHAKSAEPELYWALSKAVQSSPYFTTVKAEYGSYYKTDAEFIDEAIAHAIEDAGARFLNKIERKNFIDRVLALLQSIMGKLRKTDLTGMTDDIVNKMFNTKGTPISEKNLAELDLLQFSKEDFDKNSYFIRHIMQKISEDDLFNRFAKSAKTAGEQEFIYQIINSMIKNTIPSSQLKGTVENYIHGFNDYIGLVNKDAFTEQYIKSEIAKLETSSILRSMVSDSTKNQSSLKRLLDEGWVDTSWTFINQLDVAIIQMSKNLGLKRIFFGQTQLQGQFVKELQNTIDVIKNSDMSLVQKQKALIEQSIAYSNDFITSLYEKIVKKENVGFSYKVNNKKISVKPEVLYQMLQIMRMPDFAASSLWMKDFMMNKNVRANLKKYYDVTAEKIEELNVNKQEARRVVSQVPVNEIPVNKNTVIITSEARNPNITYAEFTDNNGKYMTVDRFLSSDIDANTTYLVSANFFARSSKNPEMTAFLDKIQESKNVYPVAFSVVQSNGKNMVEVNGYDQLKKHFAIQYTSFEMPEFKFDYAPSKKSLSRLSENSANTASRKEMGEMIDGTYIENPNAKEVLEGMGVNPVTAPTVNEAEVIHSFGELGKIGEIYRQVLSAITSKASAAQAKKWAIESNDYITSDKFIITDDIKNEYLDAITGNEDLDAIYLNGKTLTESINEELSAVELQDSLRNLTEDLEEMRKISIDDTDFITPAKFTAWQSNAIKVLEASIDDVTKSMTEAKKATLGEAIRTTTYPSGKEAFNQIVKTLKDAGYGYTKISSIIKTIAAENPGWKNDILTSDASEFLPSFDAFVTARMANPLIQKYNVTPEDFRSAMEATYERVHSATFRKHYPENDTIIQLFLKSLQKFEVLDQADDVFAITKNMQPEQKEKLHILINNIYSGDIQRVVLDENTEAYTVSLFNQLYRQFAEGTKKELSTGDKDTLKEMSGVDESDDGLFTTDASVITYENSYNQVMKDFVSQLSDYHQFEFDSMLPETFLFRETRGKPLYESSINLNVWATQPDHKVLKTTPSNIESPIEKATKASILDRSTRLKAYGVFNSKSVATISKYAEYNAFDTFEKLPFKTKENLQDVMQQKNIRIQTEVNDITEDVLTASLNKAEKDINADKIEEINKFIKEYKGEQSELGVILREAMRNDYSFLAEYYASSAKPFLDKKSEVIGRMLWRNKALEEAGANAKEAKIGWPLFGKILNNIVQNLEAYKLKRMTDWAKDIPLHPIFTMVTDSGAKRSYYLNTLTNSPIFRTIIAEAGAVKYGNPLMQILDYGRYLKKEFLNNHSGPSRIFTQTYKDTLSESAPKYLKIKQSARTYHQKKIISDYFDMLKQASMQKQIRLMAKIEKLYWDTIGQDTIERYEYTNAQWEVIQRYAGDDDNINTAKSYLGTMMSTELKIDAAIDDITGFSPIKTEGDGFDFKIEKDSLTPIEQIEYSRINPEYLDSYDFSFVYTNLTHDSPDFGKQFEAVFTWEWNTPKITNVRPVTEEIEIPKNVSKIDEDFSTLAETATCEITSNLF